MDVDAVNKQHHITCRPFFFYTTFKKINKNTDFATLSQL